MASPIPRSNPNRLFYWGFIQDIVYSTPVADLEDLHQKIIAACATVVLQEVHTYKFISCHPKLWKSLCRFPQMEFSSINYLVRY